MAFRIAWWKRGGRKWLNQECFRLVCYVLQLHRLAFFIKTRNHFKEEFFGKPEYQTIIKEQTLISIKHRFHRGDLNGSSAWLDGKPRLILHFKDIKKSGITNWMVCTKVFFLLAKVNKKMTELTGLDFARAMTTYMCKEPRKWCLFLCMMTMRHNRQLQRRVLGPPD